VSVVLALIFDVTRYEGFLLLIGAVFVPLFGVLAADYFVIRRGHYEPAAVLGTGGPTAIAAGVRWQGVLAWALGLLAYLWIAGRLEPFGLAGAPTLGASLPSLGLAAVVYLGVTRR
jgi:NCS1 family nucleobase:cation symporter-1